MYSYIKAGSMSVIAVNEKFDDVCPNKTLNANVRYKKYSGIQGRAVTTTVSENFHGNLFLDD